VGAELSMASTPDFRAAMSLPSDSMSALSLAESKFFGFRFRLMAPASRSMLAASR
jgi:hypothetical protein